MLERMSQRMNESFDVLRDEHNTRMKNVMANIRALSDSMAVSAEHGAISSEMQRLRHQVERYDQIFPIRQAQVKELEQMNRKLRADLLEGKYRNERMKARLDKAESDIFHFASLLLRQEVCSCTAPCQPCSTFPLSLY